MMITTVTVIQVWLAGHWDDRRRSDVLIVLGASQYNGRPSAVFAARLDHVLDLYRQNVAPRIVTVGGAQIGDAYTEGQAGANYLLSRGVPATDLVVVGEGRDTLGSLQSVAKVMVAHQWRTAVIVTDPWHSLRSRTMARDLDIDAVVSSVTVGPATRGFLTQLRYIVRECAAYRFYELFHRATPVGRAPSAV
ncbi:YdcF family protein [Frankia sp. Cppng1_Ct_nod]|uniref:YdcF family protein n=1 Tax=Frankia sp. Cppng1_Ct_nod TaxID=2897162 RepID=UPI00104130D5|nr:YdcF family protein [Frankia sp. Cppng1_Ct_nod]